MALGSLLYFSEPQFPPYKIVLKVGLLFQDNFGDDSVQSQLRLLNVVLSSVIWTRTGQQGFLATLKKLLKSNVKENLIFLKSNVILLSDPEKFIWTQNFRIFRVRQFRDTHAKRNLNFFIYFFSNQVLVFILNFSFEMFLLTIICAFDFNSSCVILRFFLPTVVMDNFSLNLFFQLVSTIENSIVTRHQNRI